MSVMQNIKVDYSIPLREIGPLLDRLSRETADDEGGYPVPEEVDIEALISGQQLDAEELIASVDKIGDVSKLTCPDCHGALWEIRDDQLLRYRCHVGHAFSAESLNEGQMQMLEVALWSAVRALEEQMVLARHIVQRARKANHTRAVATFEKRAKEAERNSGFIRRLLLGNDETTIVQPVIEGEDQLRM
jgi:two-component system chemotaxis response regulator CheB